MSIAVCSWIKGNAKSGARAAVILKTVPTAATIKPILSDPKAMPKEVTIYTTNHCPYCDRAKALFKRKNVLFTEIDVTHNDKARSELEEKTGWYTVPQIFIGEKFVGGSDDVHALEAEGKLDDLLQ